MNPKVTPITAALLITITIFTLLYGQAANAPVVAQSEGEDTLHQLFLPAISSNAPQTQAQSTFDALTDTHVIAAGPSTTGATIATDQADYPPSATVTLTGLGWAAGESVHIFVNDDSSQSWTHNSNPDPVADGNGAFTYSFQLPSYFVANYSVVAGPGSLGSGTATTNFTDLSVGTYDQCSNDVGTGYTTGDTGCRWINGNLQSNNSRYFEGDATVQRLWLTEFVPGSTHSVTLKYGTTKGGKHAYDFLTTWDWSENWITLADRCQSITGCISTSENALDIPQDPNVPNSFEPSAAGDRQFVMRGGALNSATTPVIASGSYAGDSETVITISFTVGNSGDMCEIKQGTTSCSVALWFGAHVAAQANWGLGQGAGSISGSPYHVALDAIDGAAVGQRDNQMQAGAVTVIPNGTIIIVKDAIPNDAQDFSFNLNNNGTISQDFLLDDDADMTLPNSQTFSVPPGSWTATELNIPSGWTLTNLVCVDPTSNTTVNGAAATINLASNETVTCTYTNTKEADKLDLTVTKTATPSFTRTYSWGISKNVDKSQINIAEGGTATFNYTVDVTHNSGTDSGWQVIGSITVNNPNSFGVAGVSITDAINDANATCSVTGGSATIAANSSATFSYSCTYAAAPAAASQTNTATATWTAFGSPTTSAQGTASVDWNTVNPSLFDESFTVTDPNAPTPPLPATVSYTDPSPQSFLYAKTFSGDPAGSCADHNNTATFTTNDSNTIGTASKKVTVCVGKDLTVTKTATPAFKRTFTWDIAKNVDKTRVNIAAGGSATFNYTVDVTHASVDSDWTVVGQIIVVNPNNWQDIVADVSDTVNNGGSCTVTGGSNVTVPKSGQVVLNYTCTYPAGGPTTADGINTASVTWDAAAAFTPTGSASGTAPFAFTAPTVVGQPGPLHVTDSLGGALGTVAASDASPTRFTYSQSFEGVAGTCTPYNNIATITETNQSDNESVLVCVGKDLTVTKTAATSFTRTYVWTLDKSVDDTLIEIADGDTATFQYKVTVNHDDGTDSAHKVVGQITVSNPNDWQDIVATVTDALDTGACTVTDGVDVTIPKGDSVTLAYSCDPASAAATKNTATATWDKALYFTPSDTATGDATVTFGSPTLVNESITVVDDKTNPANPVTLGTASVSQVNPIEFAYTLVKTGVAGTCTDYTNTAKITQTGQVDSQEVTVCVGKDLTVTKTATASFDRTYKWLIDKSVDDTRIEIAQGGTATFNYTVKVTPNGFADSGYTLAGTITVHNPNDWQPITADVSDTLDQGGSCTVTDGTNVVIPAGQSVTLNYTCTTDGSPTQNTATASWNKDTFFTPSGTASGEADVNFALDQETNKVITVVDDKTTGTAVTLGTSNYMAGPFEFTYALTKNGVAGACTDYTNTATIDETGQNDEQPVTVCVGKDLTVTKTATASLDRMYKWLIDKSVDDTRIEIAAGGTATFNYEVKVTPNGFKDGGYTLGGTITIANPNAWQNVTVDVADTLDQGGTCTSTEAAPYVVPMAGSLTLHYTCTTDGSTTQNTATVSWNKATYFTPNDTASGEAAVTFALDQESNKVITVVDDKTNPATPVTLGTWDWSDGVHTFTYALDKQGVAGACTNYTNTAKISETNQGDSQIVTVCVGQNLTVTKTAVPAFKRLFAWDITKAVDKTLVKQAKGTVTFNYTVNVNQTGFTDSLWQMTGKITVVNPNSWQDIVVNVSDAVDNAGSCTVAGGTTVTVLKGGTKVFDYTCTYASAPTATNGINTATVTWDKTLVFTPNGLATGTAAFAFGTGTTGNPTAVNQTITVQDTFNGTTNTLGTATATATQPYTTKSFTYPRTVPVPTTGCRFYPNTAKIVETGQSASQTVQVCGPINLGAKTIGFWQNKNGQAIIKAAGPSTGTCTLTPWLRQFAPFQDLSATASCSAVATYVTNVIKAANSSGSSMNPMLKAQMLATALDVYFSNPALGGNKINAPVPIGGVTIDLTKICKMSDGSGGTATCGGTLQNASTVFGGATSLTVMQMLTYAASQSNVGGTTWYGNVKATQELAKNAFDVINNNVALAP